MPKAAPTSPPLTAKPRAAAPVCCAGAAVPLVEDEAELCVCVAIVVLAEAPVLAAAPEVAFELPVLAAWLALPDVVGPALAPSFSAPAVIVTANDVRSVYVSVLLPGKFASLPLALSLQTAVEAPMLQSCVAVKSSSPGSDMSMSHIEGP